MHTYPANLSFAASFSEEEKREMRQECDTANPNALSGSGLGSDALCRSRECRVQSVLNFYS